MEITHCEVSCHLLQIYAASCNKRASFRNYVITALYSGLRNPCEMTALKWADHIDFVEEVIKVRRRVLKIEGETKTEAGNRNVPLLPMVKKALKDQKKFSDLTSEYVFLHPATNKLIEHPQLVRLWKTLHKKAGVRWRPFKQTRHTFVSMMCMSGENIFGLAKIIGHKNAKMIFESYMRFIKDANTSHAHTFVNDWSKIA